MSPPTRDPRVDPHPGDELQGKRTQRDVFEITPDVEFEFFVGWRESDGREWYSSAAGWREWSRDAEVLHVAE